MEFRCKEFSLNHSLSAQKIGTDAILLSALSPNVWPQTVLDIGCGCGIISLCMAQRHSQATITAIDCDFPSFVQAQDNFQNSQFATRLHARCILLQNFAKGETQTFDLIVSNPPYFNHSLKSPKQQRNSARHTDSLPFEDLAICVKKLLKQQGVFCLILPSVESKQFESIAMEQNLYSQKRIHIFPCTDKPCERVVTYFALTKQNNIDEHSLILRNEDNTPSQEYNSLVSEFLL